jgi:hypothetical protein
LGCRSRGFLRADVVEHVPVGVALTYEIGESLDLAPVEGSYFGDPKARSRTPFWPGSRAGYGCAAVPARGHQCGERRAFECATVVRDDLGSVGSPGLGIDGQLPQQRHAAGEGFGLGDGRA